MSDSARPASPGGFEAGGPRLAVGESGTQAGVTAPSGSRPATFAARATVRPVRWEDAGAIHRLLVHGLPGVLADPTRWHRRWLWQYRDNPYRQDRAPGWVVVDGDEILGHLGAVYLPLTIGGQRALGVVGADYVVSPRAAQQGQPFGGLELARSLFSASAGDAVVMATTANALTNGVFGRFGCRAVAWTKELWRAPTALRQQVRACGGARSRFMRRMVRGWPGRLTLPLVERVYRGRGTRPTVPLPASLRSERAGADACIELGQWCEAGGGAALGGGASCPSSGRRDTGPPISSAEARDGSLPMGRFGMERSAACFAWRYAQHPERDQVRVILLRDGHDQPVAGLVMFLERRARATTAVVQDLIAPPDDLSCVRGLLCEALRWAGEEGADYLITMNGRYAWRGVYWELGFEARARSAPAAVIQHDHLEGPLDDLVIPEPLADHLSLWHGAMF